MTGLLPAWNDYIPHVPTGPQLAFLTLNDLEAFYGGAAGGGKDLSLDTPIPAPAGWTAMGDLHAGDTVFDERGRPCAVTVAHPVDLAPRACYRLTFDDGSQIEAGADHRWLTYSAVEMAALSHRTPAYREARRERRGSRVTGNKSRRFTAAIIDRNRVATPPTFAPPTGAVRCTEEIAASLLTPSGRRNHAIRVAGPLDLGEMALPIDPYLFGLWLGDGTSTAGTFTTMDTELAWAFHGGGFHLGATSQHSRATTYGFHGLAPLLRTMGVLGNKHVPAVYLRASRRQRLALLQGLMDTDGTAAKEGQVEFTTTSYALATAAHDLIVGLGWKVRLVEGRAKLNGRDMGPKWDLKWTPTERVFRLARKLDRQRMATRRTTRFRYIVACERILTKPMRCITVDSPSGLYLAGRSMIPTHNSDALLMGALQYVHVPGYAALIIRRTFPRLTQPEALIPRSRAWLAGRARWNGSTHTWTFPPFDKGGATLTFGYLEHPGDEYQYAGPAFQYIGWDELGEFPDEGPYRFLFSRLRRLQDFDVPLRVRAASNPGGPGHDWVKRRLITEGPSHGRPFIRARLKDNPYLDRATYEQSLDQLGPVEKAQLLEGDWEVRPAGTMFNRGWFEIVPEAPARLRWCRYWDLAATKPRPGRDPDFTAGPLVGLADGVYYVADMRRVREDPGNVEQLIAQTAAVDRIMATTSGGGVVAQRMEQEPGASGVNTIAHYARHVLVGHDFAGVKTTGSKVDRARPFSAAAQAGNVKLVDGPWIGDFLDEVEMFPGGSHDDQVDGVSGAIQHLSMSGLPEGMDPVGTSSRPSRWT